MTYIGNIKEMASILKSLSHYPGFERLQAEIESKDWEQFESAFAVAREAFHFRSERIPLEFEPEVMANGKRKTPDFRAYLSNRWVYFEVKASSMFPSEKGLLKIEDKIHKGLKSITSDLKFVIKIHQEKFSEEDITLLVKSIKKKASELWPSVGTDFPQIYFYPDNSNPIAECIFLGIINSVIYKDDVQSVSHFTPGEEFIMVQGAIPKRGKGNFVLLETVGGRKLMFMGSEEFNIQKYVHELAMQLYGTKVNLNDDFGLLFLFNVINFLSTNSYVLIGVSPPYRPENRVRNKLDEALEQLPPDNPNVVIIYSREVILRMSEIGESLNKMFASHKYGKVSGVIADIQLATSEKRRKLFTNPNAIMPLAKDEVNRLNFYRE